jgi:aryl-alcohol dehydrogenase-like predicted oxidoreductase
MEYTRLGNSGLKISKVIFGCMSFGTPEWQEWVLDEAAALPLLKYAYDVGLNTWDTADVYSNGKSEEIIGKALKQYNIPRNKVVILSKCYFGVADDGSQPPIAASSTNDGPMVNQVGLSRKHILDAVEKSVARLGTYIDVLQIHRLDRETNREEIMRALIDVVESGKVRYIGASSVGWICSGWSSILKKNRWPHGNSRLCKTSLRSTIGISSSQCRTTTIFCTVKKVRLNKGPYEFKFCLSVFPEREMIPYCRDVGVGLIPWSPIARGALSRPYDDRSTTREKTDRMLKAMIRGKETEIDKHVIGRVEEIAKKHGVSMTTVATAWCLSKDKVNPIIGLSSKERIDQAVESVHFASSDKLTKEDIEYLEEGYAPKERQGY